MNPQADFCRIYANGFWGQRSGNGSSLANVSPVLEFLTAFIDEHDIINVVDIGCGYSADVFGRLHLWRGWNYCGVDVVPSLILKNHAEVQHWNSRPATARFVRMDFLEATKKQLQNLALDPSRPTLIFAKDVHQHLSDREVVTMQNAIACLRCLLDDSHVVVVTDVAEGAPSRCVDQTRRAYPFKILDFGLPRKLFWSHRMNATPVLKGLYDL